jgi:hypothetical protein
LKMMIYGIRIRVTASPSHLYPVLPNVKFYEGINGLTGLNDKLLTRYFNEYL